MPAVSSDEVTPQAERVEQMKREFLAAQQRRRGQKPATSPSGGTDDGPLQAGPADETPGGIAAVRP